VLVEFGKQSRDEVLDVHTPNIACLTLSLSMTPCRARLLISSALEPPELRHAMLDSGLDDTAREKRERMFDRGTARMMRQRKMSTIFLDDGVVVLVVAVDGGLR
jgi:hypothetical protein